MPAAHGWSPGTSSTRARRAGRPAAPRRAPRRGDQRSQLGLAIADQRRRDADEHGIAARQRRRARCRLDLAEHGLKLLVGHVLDVRAPLAQRVDLAPVDVHRDHVAPRLSKGDSEREAHVADAGYPDGHDAGECRGLSGSFMGGTAFASHWPGYTTPGGGARQFVHCTARTGSARTATHVAASVSPLAGRPRER